MSHHGKAARPAIVDARGRTARSCSWRHWVRLRSQFVFLIPPLSHCLKGTIHSFGYELRADSLSLLAPMT